MNRLGWRAWGYRSQLWRLRCGPSSSSINQQNALTQQQVGLSQQQMSLAQEQQAQSAQDLQRRDTLQAPLIAKEQALATGDPKAVLSASLPALSQITGSYTAAKENIMNSTPAGAARDFALSQLPMQAAGQFGAAKSAMVNSAPETLANLGSGLGAFSLQELGASLSGFSGAGSSLSGASNSNSQLMGAQNAQSAAKLGVLGDVVGAAGTAAGGALGRPSK